MERKSLLSARRLSTYTVENDDSVMDIVRHFTSRGHKGPVQCLAAPSDVNYIISGGADYTVRIWRYSTEYECYYFHAMLSYGRPLEDEPASGLTSFCAKSKDWRSAPRQGVTAVATASSQSQALHVGEQVAVDKDLDYVINQFDYSDLIWDDDMEVMVGESFRIEEVGSDTVGLASSDGTIREFPLSVLEREQSPPVRDGPFLSATAHGDVSVLCLFSGQAVTTFSELHAGPVNALCVVPLGLERASFLAVTAGDDGDAAALKLDCEERQMDDLEEPVLVLLSAKQQLGDDEQPLRLRHAIDDKPVPVLDVRHVGAFEEREAVSLVTLARDGARLWNLQGDFLMQLTVQKNVLIYNPSIRADELVKPEIKEYQHLCAVNKTSGSLILLAGGDYVAVWAIEEGVVQLPKFATLDRKERLNAWQQARAKFAKSGVCPVPTCTYRSEGHLIDCHQAQTTTKFAVQVDEGQLRCKLWNLCAIQPEQLALEPPGAAALLIMPGWESLLMTLRHQSPVWCIKVMEDPGEGYDDSGAALITGCENGHVFCWDVEGNDSKQVYARLRSLTLVEIIVPPLLLVVSTVQIMSFAFGPTVPWRVEVQKPAVAVYRVMLLDLKYSISIPRKLIFWMEVYVVVSLMLAFVLIATLGLSFRLDRLLHRVQDTACFKNEWRMGCCHLLLYSLRFVRKGVQLGVQACATVLVVPMFQVCAQALDCEYPDGDEAPHLADYPDVKCNEGSQWKLKITLLFLLPVYFCALVPYAVVSGDTTYVPTTTFYNWKMWTQAARRKVTDQYMGFLHKTPSTAFSTPFTELVAKSVLPFITTELTNNPLLQMSLISAVGAFMYAQSLCRPPFMEVKFLIVVQDLKLMTLCSMLSGLLVVVLDKAGMRQAWLPVVLLMLLLLCTTAHVVFKLCTVPLRRSSVRVFDVEAEGGREDP